MSRRDEADSEPSASRCSSPAGASPASVSAGAPSSRPQAQSETTVARAGCQKPLRREPVRGPQHQVKPAASTQLQPESRAAHLTAKAMSPVPQSGGARTGGLGGVQGAARGHGEERNTRGPSAQPGSGQRGSYKPMVKSTAAQRASEGTVVVKSLVTNNARGAKCAESITFAGSDDYFCRSRSARVAHHRAMLGCCRRPVGGRGVQQRRSAGRRAGAHREP